MMNNMPAAMEGASAFEVYVFMHKEDRTIGQIRKLWHKTTAEIQSAIDKAVTLKWPYIPQNELPKLPHDGLRREHFGLGDYRNDTHRFVTPYRKCQPRISPEKVAAIKECIAAGWSQRRIRKHLHVASETILKVKMGGFDV